MVQFEVHLNVCLQRDWVGWLHGLGGTAGLGRGLRWDSLPVVWIQASACCPGHGPVGKGTAQPAEVPLEVPLGPQDVSEPGSWHQGLGGVTA